MPWIFAIAVIWFSIVSSGFRKLVFWLMGLGAAVIVISVAANGIR